MDNNENTIPGVEQEQPIKPKGSNNKPANGSFKLDVFDWMKQIPKAGTQTEIVEVRFKNTRKEYFENVNGLPLEVGETIAVEASPGHDIGIVSLTGDLVLAMLKKSNIARPKEGFKKIYRKARQADIDKWEEAKAMEHTTMIQARQISKELRLDMKIGDVEYQGDKTKAIFYYIAEERVDFRELIKVLAERFKIRVEMRQIGARQEAGRIGGIGTCGKELCCSSFITKFVSVTTNAARYQELSLNPQKLAGQCGKLKCCLNFEVDSYIDAQKDFPSTGITLEYKDGRATYSKTDVYKRTMWYFAESPSGNQFIGISVDRVKEIIEMNRAGKKPDVLVNEKDNPPVIKELDYDNVVGQESLTRFDDASKKRKQNNNNNNNKRRNNNNSNNRIRPTEQGREASDAETTSAEATEQKPVVQQNRQPRSANQNQGQPRPQNQQRPQNQSRQQGQGNQNQPRQQAQAEPGEKPEQEQTPQGQSSQGQQPNANAQNRRRKNRNNRNNRPNAPKTDQ